MMRKKAAAYAGTGLGFLALSVIRGCGGNGPEASRPLASSCSEEDLRLARERDSLSAPCRNALASLLPRAEDDLAGRIRVAYRSGAMRDAGAGTQSGGVAGPTTQGEGAETLALVGLPLATLADAETVEVSVDGGTSFAPFPLGRPAPGEVALSVVTDYSGSLRSTDVALAERINARLWACAPSGTPSHVVAFSSEVRERKGFGDDPSELSEVQGVDTSLARKLTALHAALITSAGALGKTGARVRLLLAHTDGRENASKFTVAETTAALDAARAVPFIAGHFLTDVPKAKALVKGRGFFLYAPSLSEFPEERVCSLLKSVRTLTVESDRPTGELRLRIARTMYGLEGAP